MFTQKTRPESGTFSHTKIKMTSMTGILAVTFCLLFNGNAYSFSPGVASGMNGLDSNDQMAGYINRFDQSSSHILNKDFDKAVPLLEDAVEADPINVFAVYNLGYSYLELAEKSQDHEQINFLLDKAEASLVRAHNFNPQLDVVYFKLGKIALLRGDSQQALHYYKTGTEYLPENAAMQFNLGRIYDQQGNIGKALKHYKKSIDLDPTFKYAYNNAGLLYELQGDFENAKKSYEDALKVDTNYNYARLNLGNLYAEQEEYDKAVDIYLEALSYQTDNPWAHLYLANVYFMSERFEKAIPHYQSAIDSQPDNANAYYLIAIAYNKTNQVDKALEASNAYMEIEPNGKFSSEVRNLIVSLKLKMYGISLNTEK